MCKLNKKNGLWRIDPCMRNLIKNIQWLLGKDFGTETKIGSSWKIVSCCCGHRKYPMTIVVESPHGKHLEIVSDEYIDRKKRFYKKDEQGYYYIPELLNPKQEICKCGHKQWDDHKCTFEPLVAQECSVKGCKCKKFKRCNSKPEVIEK